MTSGTPPDGTGPSIASDERTMTGDVLASTFDESSRWDSSWRSVLSDLPRLAEWSRRADRLLLAEGAGHLVHDLPVRADGRGAGLESRPWRIDPLPFLVDPPTFQWLAAAVAERMEGLEALLDDLHGARRTVTDGVVPSDRLHASPRYRMIAVGAPAPRRWLTTYAVDLVRTSDGEWHVVQDLTDAPAGMGYALLDRSVMARVAHDVVAGHGIATLARYPDVVRRALAGASELASPRTVVFTGGIDHPSYVDHSYLAVQLGVTLVEGADLVVRQRRLFLRTLDGVEPVDVVYRRLESESADPLEVGSTGTAGVPGLLLAVRSGGVALANAHGAGVVEDPDLRDQWSDAIEALVGGRPRLGLLPAHRAGDLATAPCFDDDPEGPRLTHAPVVLRMFAVSDGHRVTVLPGGTGRVLTPGDDPRLPTACLAKDVWVLGSTLTPVASPPLPQVDFGRSVPTRAAASLYWMNRSAERAEAVARVVRVVSARLEQDPGLGPLGGGAWSERMQWLVRWLRRAPDDVSDLPGIDALYDELARAGDSVADEIGNLLTEATSVREFLSVTTGRVLEQIARRRASLQRHVAEVDDLDGLLTDLAALAGLWNESTVRGPAWRIGDIGRAIERSMVVLDALVAAMPEDEPGGWSGVADRGADLTAGLDPMTAADVDRVTVEVLLAANESLVAYRRRHRSDVEVGAACALLVRDASNPRSLAAGIERIARHSSDAGWETGVVLAGAARDALGLDLAELVPTVRGVLDELGRAVTGHWFAAPVSPVVMVERRA